MNRDTSIDTIRVVSVLLVVWAHFSNFFDFKNVFWVHFGPASWPGSLGVILFFGISGFLMGKTLERKEKLLNFYKKKLLRLVIPWVIAYIFMTIVYLMLGLIDNNFFSFTPVSWFLWNSSNLRDILNLILFMIPYENHVVSLLGFNKLFIGEWFVGTLVFLYFISPLLYKCIESKYRYFFGGVFIFIGILFYYIFGHLFVSPWWFFIARIPEYYLGILIYKDKQLLSNKLIKRLMLLGLAVSIIKALYEGNIASNYINNFLPQTPELYISALPIIYFSFIIAKYMQNIPGISIINSLAPIGYSIILLQHTIIYALVKHIYIPTLNFKGYTAFLVVDLLITLYLSKKLYHIYTPIEDYLISKVSR